MSPGRATGSPAGTGSSPRSATPWTVANATWTNTIGSPELSAVWQNLDLKPEERAFYYGTTSPICGPFGSFLSPPARPKM